MQKRGLSGVIVTVLMILLAIIAVIVLWQVVKGVLTSSSGDIETSRIFVDLEARKNSVSISSDSASLKLVRNSGKGDLIAVRFILENKTGSYVYDAPANLGVQEERVFSIPIAGKINEITKIKFAPIINNNGKNVTGIVKEAYSGGSLSSGGCAPLWSCSDWGVCSGGIQERPCTDSNSCGTACSGQTECITTRSCQTPCTDECSPSGAKTCEDINSYETCGNYDSDSCLEWSSATNCQAGESCSEGNCVQVTQISSCPYTISSSGNYVLTEDLNYAGTTECIKITANDVSLDCKNFRIGGTGGSSTNYGISVRNDPSVLNSITIKKCSVSGLGTGIYFYKVQESKIIESIIQGNIANGIFLEQSPNNYINNTQIDNQLNGAAGRGIYLVGSNFNKIKNNNLENNRIGIQIISSSSNNLIENNTIKGTIDTAIFILSSNYNGVWNNTIRASQAYGIYILSSSIFNKIQNNTISDISYRGISVVGSSTSNYIIGNNITRAGGTTYPALYIEGSNIIEDNILFYNYDGLSLSSASNSKVKNNLACFNTRYDAACSSSNLVFGSTGNRFRQAKIYTMACNDNWPVLNTHYTECPPPSP